MNRICIYAFASLNLGEGEILTAHSLFYVIKAVKYCYVLVDVETRPPGPHIFQPSRSKNPSADRCNPRIHSNQSSQNPM